MQKLTQKPILYNKSNIRKLASPTVLLLDFDNTLVNTWDIMIKSLHRTMIYFDLKPWDVEYIKRQMHVPMKDYFPELFGKNDTEARKKYSNFYKEYSDLLIAMPNAEEMLDYTLSKGIKMSVISNKRIHVLEDEVINKFNWGKYFFHLRGAEEGKVNKPDKGVVEEVLSLINTKTGKNIWFIGDSYIDVLAGKNSNCSSILFGNEGEITREVIKEHQPDWYTADHKTLIHALDLKLIDGK